MSVCLSLSLGGFLKKFWRTRAILIGIFFFLVLVLLFMMILLCGALGEGEGIIGGSLLQRVALKRKVVDLQRIRAANSRTVERAKILARLGKRGVEEEEEEGGGGEVLALNNYLNSQYYGEIGVVLLHRLSRLSLTPEAPTSGFRLPNATFRCVFFFFFFSD